MKAKTKILIVEDESIIAKDIQSSLKYFGYTVSSIVSSAEEAIKEVEENKPDLVLMDIKLRGDMDGVEATERIRAHFDIPIVYITGLSDELTFKRAKKTKPFGYIHKPIEKKDLNTTVEMALYRHEMERELKESKQYFRSIFEGSRDAIFIVGEYSRFVEVNEAASTLTGYSKEELKKMSIPDLHEAADLHAYKAYYDSIMAGEKITSEAKILRKDGTKVDTEFSNKRIFIGGVPYMHSVGRDITERKRAEEEKERFQAQLAYSDKMAGIGTLAGGIAHEFNNLLQIIRGYAEFAQETRRQKDIEEALDTIISNSDKAGKIIKDLLLFSSQEESEKELCDITELIELVLSLLENQLKKENIRLVRKYEDIPKIKVNKAEIRQVFLNIITNARDAMLPEGGKLEIGVKQVKKNVEVSFTDTGRGIEGENLKKVFDPFHTTKGALGGSDIPGIGLGLFVSYRIVQRYGGTVGVESRVNKGTTFTVKLPLKRAEAKK